MTHVTTKELIDLLDDESNSISASYFPDIAQRLRELEKGSQWKPIETAPKDGSSYLVWAGGVGMAHWVGTFQSGYPHNAPFSENLARWNNVEGATHWMHLPKAPEAIQGEKQ